MIVDFGNGIATDGITSDIGAAASGMDVPDFEVYITENAVFDGGSIGGTRTPCRRMTIPVLHDKVWTRHEIMRAFTPGVERLISTDRGSMPYFVEHLHFPSLMEEAEREFTVVLVSPLAYPRGPVQQASAADVGYTNATHNTGTQSGTTDRTGLPVYSGYSHIARTFTVPAGHRLVSAGLWFNRFSQTTVLMSLLDRDELTPTPGQTFASANVTLASNGLRIARVSSGRVLEDISYVTLLGRFKNAEAAPRSGPRVSGVISGESYHRNASGNWVSGDTVDSTREWWAEVTIGTPSIVTTTATVICDTDMPTPPRIRVVLAQAASALTISDGQRTATITGALLAGDVVVLDTADYSLTVNGVNRIAWLDRDGAWPMLNAGATTITTSVPGEIQITWRSRLMGLI